MLQVYIKVYLYNIQLNLLIINIFLLNICKKNNYKLNLYYLYYNLLKYYYKNLFSCTVNIINNNMYRS